MQKSNAGRDRNALQGLPDEYFERMNVARRDAINVISGSGAIAMVLDGIFIFYPGATIFPAVISTAIFLMLAHVHLECLVPAEARRNWTLARIVPYFEFKPPVDPEAPSDFGVPGEDTFFDNGYHIARNFKRLDALASEAGQATISSFGFDDSYWNVDIDWHEPAAGIAAFKFLAERLRVGAPGITDPSATCDELEKIVRRLQAAQRMGTRFCLHLRIDDAYSGAEIANRQGSY